MTGQCLSDLVIALVAAWVKHPIYFLNHFGKIGVINSDLICKRRLKSAAGVMCVTRRFKSAASSLTMKHVSQYERLD